MTAVPASVSHVLQAVVVHELLDDAAQLVAAVLLGRFSSSSCLLLYSLDLVRAGRRTARRAFPCPSAIRSARFRLLFVVLNQPHHVEQGIRRDLDCRFCVASALDPVSLTT
jgi:hypothetical protein